MDYFKVQLNEKKMLSEKDIMLLNNLHSKLKETHRVFMHKGTYPVFIKYFPETANYYKEDVDNGWIVYDSEVR